MNPTDTIPSVNLTSAQINPFEVKWHADFSSARDSKSEHNFGDGYAITDKEGRLICFVPAYNEGSRDYALMISRAPEAFREMDKLTRIVAALEAMTDVEITAKLRIWMIGTMNNAKALWALCRDAYKN